MVSSTSLVNQGWRQELKISDGPGLAVAAVVAPDGPGLTVVAVVAPENIQETLENKVFHLLLPTLNSPSLR